MDFDEVAPVLEAAGMACARNETILKQVFRIVGINFTRKALVEKGVPLVAIPLSAGVNDVSTRLLANQAIRYYETEVG